MFQRALNKGNNEELTTDLILNELQGSFNWSFNKVYCYKHCVNFKASNNVEYKLFSRCCIKDDQDLNILKQTTLSNLKKLCSMKIIYFLYCLVSLNKN